MTSRRTSQTRDPIGDLRLLYEAHPSGENPLKIICPFHEEGTASFAIYADHGWCYGCRKWEGYFAHVRRVGLDPFVEEDRLKLADQLIVPSDSCGGSIAEPPSIEVLYDLKNLYHKRLIDLYTEKLNWLFRRGISYEAIGDYSLGYTGRAYSIPIYDSDGLLTIRYRRDDILSSDAYPKYWGTTGLNGTYLYAPRLSEFDSPPKMVLCEGEFDAIIASQLGYAAVSFTNGIGAAENPDPFRSNFEGRTNELVIAVDHDGPGFSGALKLRRYFEPFIPKVWIADWGWRYKDLSEVFAAGGESAVHEILSRNTPLGVV